MAVVSMSAEDRRGQIIRVAADLFAQNGFKGTTTKKIAQEAGITEALVFKYFETKESLYTAIFENKIQELAHGICPISRPVWTCGIMPGFLSIQHGKWACGQRKFINLYGSRVTAFKVSFPLTWGSRGIA